MPFEPDRSIWKQRVIAGTSGEGKPAGTSETGSPWRRAWLLLEIVRFVRLFNLDG